MVLITSRSIVQRRLPKLLTGKKEVQTNSIFFLEIHARKTTIRGVHPMNGYIVGDANSSFREVAAE